MIQCLARRNAANAAWGVTYRDSLQGNLVESDPFRSKGVCKLTTYLAENNSSEREEQQAHDEKKHAAAKLAKSAAWTAGGVVVSVLAVGYVTWSMMT
jgi:hypothetical protein